MSGYGGKPRRHTRSAEPTHAEHHKEDILSDWTIPWEAIVERHRARIEDHDSYIPFFVEAWSIGEDTPRVITVIPEAAWPVAPRDAMLYAADVMALCLGADYIVCVYDTHISKSMINPVTGKKWGPGEMQNLCDEQGFCDTGIIRDELVVTAIRRSNRKIRLESLPYHFHRGELMEFPDRNIVNEWDRTRSDAEGTHSGGLIPDRLRAAMNRDPGALMNLLKQDWIGRPLTDELVLALRIEACIRRLQDVAATEAAIGLYTHLVMAITREERRVLRELQERYGPQIVAKLVLPGDRVAGMRAKSEGAL